MFLKSSTCQKAPTRIQLSFRTVHDRTLISGYMPCMVGKGKEFRFGNQIIIRLQEPRMKSCFQRGDKMSFFILSFWTIVSNRSPPQDQVWNLGANLGIGYQYTVYEYAFYHMEMLLHVKQMVCTVPGGSFAVKKLCNIFRLPQLKGLLFIVLQNITPRTLISLLARFDRFEHGITVCGPTNEPQICFLSKAQNHIYSAVQYTVYSTVHYTVYSTVQYTVYSTVHCVQYSTLSTVHCGFNIFPTKAHLLRASFEW